VLPAIVWAFKFDRRDSREGIATHARNLRVLGSSAFLTRGDFDGVASQQIVEDVLRCGGAITENTTRDLRLDDGSPSLSVELAVEALSDLREPPTSDLCLPP